ncbi:MAG: DUF192 domain-containing protein [archaeon]
MLENLSTKKTIIKKVKLAESFLSKFLGLMFSKPRNQALIFVLNDCSRVNASIHMLFVFYSINVYYLNEKKFVVDKKENLKPFTLNYTPKKPAKYFIEIPAEFAKEKVSVGDKLSW